MTRAEIITFINELEADLKTARGFLALYDRKNPPTVIEADRFPEFEDKQAESDSSEAPKYGALAEVVRGAIDEILGISDQFNLDNVMTHLSMRGVEHPRDTISQVLSRLARAQEIGVVVPGSGRRPAVYKRGDKKRLPDTIKFMPPP